MTLNSIIGFGNYRDLKVGDLINISKHSELIRMYYGLEKIDFTPDVKILLRINENREIKKPGKSYDMYHKNIYDMVGEIMSTQTEQERNIKMHEKSATVRLKAKTQIIIESKINSSMKNKLRVQAYR